MLLKNVSALLRKYSPSPGEKLPFVWSIDTDLLRALGLGFFCTLFLFDYRSYIMYSDVGKIIAFHKRYTHGF
jgi:hypothetical protein